MLYMSREYKLYLNDILDSTLKILRFTNKLTLEEFLNTEMALDAVVRNFQIIGEASQKIPQEIKSRHQSVEWGKLTSFRNVLIHEYFGMDTDILWDVIQNKLPELQKQMKDIIKKES